MLLQFVKLREFFNLFFLEQHTPSSHDGILIKAEQIELFKASYRKNNWRLNSERLGDEETIYAILPVEDIVEFIEKSEAKGAERLTIYFGVFPKPFPDYSLLAGRITLCIVGVNGQGFDVYFGEEQPEFGIGGFNGKDQIEIFKENYRIERYFYNSQAIGKPDSIGATCMFKTIKNFLLEKPEANFIRIYIAAYPDNYGFIAELSRLQTILLVAMKEDANRIAREILDTENPGLTMFPLLATVK